MDGWTIYHGNVEEFLNRKLEMSFLVTLISLFHGPVRKLIPTPRSSLYRTTLYASPWLSLDVYMQSNYK